MFSNLTFVQKWQCILFQVLHFGLWIGLYFMSVQHPATYQEFSRVNEAKNKNKETAFLASFSDDGIDSFRSCQSVFSPQLKLLLRIVDKQYLEQCRFTAQQALRLSLYNCQIMSLSKYVNVKYVQIQPCLNFDRKKNDLHFYF